MGLFFRDTFIADDDHEAATTPSPTPQAGWYPYHPLRLPDLFRLQKSTQHHFDSNQCPSTQKCLENSERNTEVLNYKLTFSFVWQCRSVSHIFRSHFWSTSHKNNMLGLYFNLQQLKCNNNFLYYICSCRINKYPHVCLYVSHTCTKCMISTCKMPQNNSSKHINLYLFMYFKWRYGYDNDVSHVYIRNKYMDVFCVHAH